MKLKLRLFMALFLLLAASAWAGKWTIDSFDESPDPGDPDNFIDGDLNPVKPAQVSQQSNVLYVRQKFEDSFGDGGSTYQIFKGRPTAEAKSLGKINLDGIPYQTLLKMKLFYKKNATGDDDLETVYFDGKDVLVEGEDPVYINLNGKMEELTPIVSKDYKVSITSDPSGATVTIAGTNKGTTPLTINLTSQKTVTAVITKEGYYTLVKPITPVSKKTTEEGVSLVSRKSLDSPVPDYKSQLQTASTNNNVNALKTLRADVKKTLDNYNSDSKKSIDAVLSKYPANPSKAGEESSSDYSARETIWKNAQAREREALNKEAQGIFNELKDLLKEIDAATTSAAAVAAAPKQQPKPMPKKVVEEEEEDDEASYDEEEDEEEIEESVAAQEKYDYSKYGASGNATQIFGNTDEYLFWTGMVFLAGAVGTGVKGFLEHSGWQDAVDAIKDIDKNIKAAKDAIESECDEKWGGAEKENRNGCYQKTIRYSEAKPDQNDSSYDPNKTEQINAITQGKVLWILNNANNTNKKTRDSYNTARIIWFSAAAVSLGISITLFAW